MCWLLSVWAQALLLHQYYSPLHPSVRAVFVRCWMQALPSLTGVQITARESTCVSKRTHLRTVWSKWWVIFTCPLYWKCFWTSSCKRIVSFDHNLFITRKQLWAVRRYFCRIYIECIFNRYYISIRQKVQELPQGVQELPRVSLMQHRSNCCERDSSLVPFVWKARMLTVWSPMFPTWQCFIFRQKVSSRLPTLKSLLKLPVTQWIYTPRLMTSFIIYSSLWVMKFLLCLKRGGGAIWLLV